MIKPLLRTLPSFSGNVKLACNIIDSRMSSDKDTWEASVRGARILPVSSHMWQSGLEAGLVSSSWEFDLPKFYAMYSDVFYKPCFEFDKSDMMRLDTSHEQKVRATDFEFGVKRISYAKNGKQFAFFAPLYIDSREDLPDYFLIEANIASVNKAGETVYAIKRKLRVNIGNEINYKKAYLGRYLDRYLAKIDDNVAFCTPLTNQATFYGIDLRHSGFVTAVDNMMDRVYHFHNTIHNVDATIAGAFKRNSIAMKQILPLSFYFSMQDMMTEQEAIRYRNAYVTFSGAYYKNGKKLTTYDWSADYMNYTEEVLQMNPITGVMEWSAGHCSNIMDVNFPSLNECRYINYEFANKLAPWFCRWKLKYTSDEHPYIINNSWAWSKNQDSYYRYGQFPSIYNQQNALARYFVDSSGVYNYDMMFPLGDIADTNSGRYLYAYAPDFNLDKTGPYNYIIDNYAGILNNYGTNWFNVITEYSDSIYGQDSIWQDVKDGRVYYNGILYDLTNIYGALDTDNRVDKFAVVLNPEMHVLPAEEIDKLMFAESTLYRQAVSQISETNVTANDSIIRMAYLPTEPNYAWANDAWDTGSKINQDELRFNEIFVEDPEGDFIDLNAATYKNVFSEYVDGGYITDVTYSKYALDYYDLDKFYLVQDAEYITNIANEIVRNEYDSIHDETLKQMIASYVMPHYGEIGNMSAYTIAADLAYAMVASTRYSRIAYENIPEWMFGSSYSYSDEEYVWGLTHNDFIVRIPDEYAGKKYPEDIIITYLLQTEAFRARWCTLTKEDETDLQTEAYEYITDVTANGGEYITIDNPGDYHHGFRSYIISLDDGSGEDPKEETIFDTWADKSYVRNSANDFDYIRSAYHTIYHNGLKYSYISTPDASSVNINYGTQLYWGSLMLASSYIPYMSGAFDSYSYMYEWAIDNGYDAGDLDDGKMINDWDRLVERHPAAYWAGCLRSWKENVANKVSYAIYNDPTVSEWEYKPILNYNDIEMARNVFCERTDWTDHMYGNMIPQSKIAQDNDVLWADPYNLAYVYAYEGKTIPEYAVFRDMYVKFLNKDHLFFWFAELYKDEWKKYNGGYDFNEFIRNEWYKYLYVAEEKLMYEPSHDGRYQGAPVRRKVYTPLARFLNFPEYYENGDVESKYRSFTSFYNSVQYSAATDTWSLPDFIDAEHGGIECLRYREKVSYLGIVDDTVQKIEEYRPIRFELVFKKKMMRVDDSLWELTHIDQDIDMYRDIYFYRMRGLAETDATLDGVTDIGMMCDYSYLYDDLHEIVTYTYLQETPVEHIIDGEVVYTYTYSEELGILDRPVIMTDDENAYIQHSDSMLVPLFDDIFAQPAIDANIYTHYSLHDITTAYIVSDMPDRDTGKYEYICKNYRFNVSDKKMMMEISDKERDEFVFTTTYKKYSDTWCKILTKYDDEELPDDLGMSYLGLSTKTVDGVNYGFYYIKAHMNNTSDSFWINGVTDDIITTHVRYIKYINGHSLESNPKYVASIFKELAPFVNMKVLSVMSKVNTIIYPRTYVFPMVYSQIPAANNGCSETDIIKNAEKIRTSSLLRYFHAMTPLIVPTTQIENEWRLKLKDVSAQLLDTGRYISLGDAPIYRQHIHINEFEPYAVYSKYNNEFNDDTSDVKDYNNKVFDYTPVEYKFYNASRGVILEPHISIKVGGKMTYDELIANETDEKVMEVFKGYVKRTRKSFTDPELVFLLNKYKVSFDSVPVGLNITRTEKLYTLSIVFDLL